MKISKLLEELSHVAHLNSVENNFWNEGMLGEYGWIILKQKIKFIRPITIKDTYSLTTYPGDYSRVRFYRNSFASVNNEVVMEQTALWSLIDIAKRRVLAPSKLNMKFPEETKGDILVEFDEHSLADDFEFCKQVEVEYSHIDINRHLNNVRYVEWCLDTFDIETMANMQIKEISLNYFHESSLKEIFMVYRHVFDKEWQFIVTGKDIDDIRFSCHIEIR